MIFRTERAVIALYARPIAKIKATVGNSDDSFVAFPLLEEEDVPIARATLAAYTVLAAYLPWENFDPPEDHPAGPDFSWAPILVNDFSDLNDDIGTVAGVSEHGQLSTLLRWQPRIDNAKTGLIAIVAPGPWNRTVVTESDSLQILGRKLKEYGYGAVGIRCRAGTEDEFTDAVSYAARLSETAGLTVLHVASEGRDIIGTPFSVSVRELRWAENS